MRPRGPAIGVRRLERPDLDSLARVHCAAFPASVLTAFGPEAVRRYYEWQLIGPHESVALGAFVGDAMAGFCVGGVFRGKMSGYLRRNFLYLASRVAVRPSLIGRAGVRSRIVAGLRILRVLPKPANDVTLYQDSDPASFGILSIGVDPRYRGTGVGQSLMAQAEHIARVRGFKSMNLSVHVSNDAAIRFYESLDWERQQARGAPWRGEMTKCLTTPSR